MRKIKFEALVNWKHQQIEMDVDKIFAKIRETIDNMDFDNIDYFNKGDWCENDWLVKKSFMGENTRLEARPSPYHNGYMDVEFCLRNPRVGRGIHAFGFLFKIKQ